MSHPDSGRGRDALASLDFFVHADLFMSPTAELADIVLPVTTPFEAEALRVGFEVSQEAQSLVQLRRRLVAPRGEARSDLQILFALAVRLGLGDTFFGGDIEAGVEPPARPQRDHPRAAARQPGGPARAGPHGTPEVRPRRSGHTAWLPDPLTQGGALVRDLRRARLPRPGGVSTSRRISPTSRPDLAREFPLVLTCAKSSAVLRVPTPQHRQPAACRPGPGGRAPPRQPQPPAACTRVTGCGSGRPRAGVRARARFNKNLAPDVVCGQHGWWQACPEVDQPGYPPYRARERQPQPRAAAGSERPDQWQRAAARLAVRDRLGVTTVALA